MNISINIHSSIRIEDGEKVIYFDPFLIEEEKHDADYIFITHDHYDHFDINSIKKVKKNSTVYIAPLAIADALKKENIEAILLEPNTNTVVDNYPVETIPSYNVSKPFHTIDKNYLAYIITVDSKRIYVAGDTDMNEDNKKVKCDIAFVPVGGKYTMDYKEASELVNIIKPKMAIPMHYGSSDIGNITDGYEFEKLVDKNIEVEVLL